MSMNAIHKIPVRVFPVRIRDERSGAESADEIILTKAQLAAAEIVGESSTELILRQFNRAGFRVLDIGRPRKVIVTVDLVEAVALQEGGDAVGTGGLSEPA